jgi:hypothetical protein
MSAGEFEGHEALIAELRAGTLDAPDHLQRRVLAGAPEKRRRWSEMSGRKRVFAVVAITATLAVGAALVHTAFSNPNSRGVLSPGPVRQGAAFAHGFRGATGAKGATGNAGPVGAIAPTATRHGLKLSSASGPYYGTAAARGNTESLQADALKGNLKYRANGSGTVQIPTHRHVHASASLQVVVPNNDALSNATHQATAIVTALGGYAQTVHQSTGTRDGSAFLDLRVPVGKANLAIEKLGALGRVVSQQVATQDLEQKYTRQVDTIGRLLRSIAVYKQALQSGSVSGFQRVEVENRLAQAEYYLAQARKAHKNTVAAAATTDIQLTLATNQHAFVAPPGKTGRFGRLLHNAAQFLALEGIIVLYVLIVAGPILLIVGLAWWLTRERRRREERELLASA